MKKILRLIPLLLLFSLVVSSCKDDEKTVDPPPDENPDKSSCDTCDLTKIIYTNSADKFITYQDHKMIDSDKEHSLEIKNCDWVLKVQSGTEPLSTFNYTFLHSSGQETEHTMKFNWNKDGSIYPQSEEHVDSINSIKTKYIFKYTNNKLTEIIKENDRLTGLMERVNYTTFSYDSKGNAIDKKYYDVFNWGKLKEKLVLVSILKFTKYDAKCNQLNNLFLGANLMDESYSNTNNLLKTTTETYEEDNPNPTSVTVGDEILYEYNSRGLPMVLLIKNGGIIASYTYGNCN